MAFGVLPLFVSEVLFTAYNNSSFSGKAIVWILLACSVAAWTVMVTKFSQIKAARVHSEHFLRAFRAERLPGGLITKKMTFPQSPLYLLYEAGIKTMHSELALNGMRSEDLYSGALNEGEFRRLTPPQLETIRIVMDRTMADEALFLESRMGLLATSVSVAPFIGLLGTVLGVLEVFSGIGQAGAMVIAAVAPGISSALLTTVIGLLVALPSTIGYNMLAARIRELNVQMDNFIQEFGSAVQHLYSVYGAEE